MWFVGGSPDLVAGVYLGFDSPRNMGSYAQGGSLAAPVFKQFAQEAMEDAPGTPFIAPKGTRMVRIDRRTGRRAYGAWPTDDPLTGVIWEAFKADTEPKRSIRREEIDRDELRRRLIEQRRREAAARANRADAEARAAARREAEAEAEERQNEFTEGGIY